LLVLLLAFALSRLGLHRIGHALITAKPGWVALAVVLMALSLLMRSIAWHETLRAALPEMAIEWAPVMRATMIGVMASAMFPGRVGEPTRIVVLTRRLPGSERRLLPIVAGTVFSQTLINLLALARRSRHPRMAAAADATARVLSLARRGLVVFARPRYGVAAVGCQLTAWALQWLACYAVVLAL